MALALLLMLRPTCYLQWATPHIAARSCSCCHAEDVRFFSFKSFENNPLCPSQQQVAHMQALVDSMDLASG